MSLVIADSRPESLTLLAAQHEDWIIRQAITLLENRVFKAGPALGSPAAVRDYLRLKLVAEPNEIFAVVFLDNQHQVLAFEPLFKGTVDQTSVYPRVVVQRALALNASALILAHQHPSGNTEPSAADRAITERLKSALAPSMSGCWITSSSARAARTRSPKPACCSSTSGRAFMSSPREPLAPVSFRRPAEKSGLTGFGFFVVP